MCDSRLVRGCSSLRRIYSRSLQTSFLSLYMMVLNLKFNNEGRREGREFIRLLRRCKTNHTRAINLLRNLSPWLDFQDLANEILLRKSISPRCTRNIPPRNFSDITFHTGRKPNQGRGRNCIFEKKKCFRPFLNETMDYYPKFWKLESCVNEREWILNHGEVLLNYIPDEVYKAKCIGRVQELKRDITRLVLEILPADVIGRICEYEITRGSEVYRQVFLREDRREEEGREIDRKCFIRAPGKPDFDIMRGGQYDVEPVYRAIRDGHVMWWTIMQKQYRCLMEKWALCEDLQRLILDLI